MVLTIFFLTTRNKKMKEIEHNYSKTSPCPQSEFWDTLYIEKARKRKTFRKKRIRKTDSV